MDALRRGPERKAIRRAPCSTRWSAISRPPSAPSLHTDETHRFLTGVLNEMMGILNRANSFAERADRTARAMKMASTR